MKNWKGEIITGIIVLSILTGIFVAIDEYNVSRSKYRESSPGVQKIKDGVNSLFSSDDNEGEIHIVAPKMESEYDEEIPFEEQGNWVNGTSPGLQQMIAEEEEEARRATENRDDENLGRMILDGMIKSASSSQESRCKWDNEPIPDRGGWEHRDGNCRKRPFYMSDYCSKKCCASDL